jgi:hypothetical protein
MDFKEIVTDRCVKCGGLFGMHGWKSERRAWTVAMLAVHNPETGRPVLATFAIHSSCKKSFGSHAVAEAFLQERLCAFLADGGDLTPTDKT